jgi:low temperature requirement protein LtrA
MSLGWMLSTTSPVHSLAISSLLGIIPIYTFMAATYDGSAAALLLVSIVLFLTWILPMGFGKSDRKAH